MKRFEFSKAVVSSVMATYFIGMIVGIYAVLAILRTYPEYSIEALVSMFTYIAAPTATAIGFYAWKAKNENIHKNPDVTEAGAAAQQASDTVIPVPPSGSENMN